MKTNEYDIRAGVVRRLLKEGRKRRDLRFEIPLGTNSSGGRADIVVLDDKSLGCVELKSGKDTFDNDAIKSQCKPYRRTFDNVAVVMDSHHLKKFKPDNHGFKSYPKCNAIYHHVENKINDNYDSEIIIPLIPALFRWSHCNTSVRDMAALLWKSECDNIMGIKQTRTKSLGIIAEEWALKDIRPRVIEQLRSRVLNQWEEKFWEKFDND